MPEIFICIQTFTKLRNMKKETLKICFTIHKFLTMQVTETVSFLNQTTYDDQGSNLKTKTKWWRLGLYLGTRPRPTNTEKLSQDCIGVRYCLTGWKLLGHIMAKQTLTWLTPQLKDRSSSSAQWNTASWSLWRRSAVCGHSNGVCDYDDGDEDEVC